MLTLTAGQQRMLEGAHGPGTAMAMRMVVGLAEVKGARRLVEITHAHIDSCLYHGESGIAYAQRLRDLGAACVVPTTTNVGAVDLLHREFRPRSETVAAGGARLMEVYAQLDVRRTWTCAPYHLPGRPGFGEHIAWAESNAIVFANSVLGARTDRYGDFLDICAAVTGLAPYAGLHLDENRVPTLRLDCSRLTESGAHVLPLLGHLAGTHAGTGVPLISGLADSPEEEGLKALGAAAASAGGVALFHVEGATPEAEIAARGAAEARVPTIVVRDADLARTRGELSGLPGGSRIDAVSLGTPHASVAELRALARLLSEDGSGQPEAAARGDRVRGSRAQAEGGGDRAAEPEAEPGTATAPRTLRLQVPIWINTGRDSLARLRGEHPAAHAVLEAAGVRIVTDTCNYLHPLMDPHVRAVMTNSVKWAHYAPGNIGVRVAFGSLAECVRAAAVGRVP
ncbi:aconitase X catalytic domain-containing protein [Brevibacterium album]|uniref:aconitase X catalytic domain-containing protein n=1 Tax=Brevibacterium album TaxID=417948 RepID=UPI000412EA0F|nr:aconitase X catalytic domain-containing protein [Brevibacterium album]